jgi:hypothetical protein
MFRKEGENMIIVIARASSIGLNISSATTVGMSAANIGWDATDGVSFYNGSVNGLDSLPIETSLRKIERLLREAIAADVLSVASWTVDPEDITLFGLF